MLDGQQQCPPVAPTCGGVDLERLDGQASPAARGLGHGYVGGAQAFSHKTPPFDADPNEDESHRELVRQPLEVVSDLHPVSSAHVHEVDIIDDDQLGLAAQDAVQGSRSELGSGAPGG